MFKVSRKGDYGLLFLSALAGKQEGGYVSLTKVVKKKKLPYKFLGQIAAELREAGLVKSKEGAGGGYRLARKAEDISVAEVLTALEGPVAPVACMREEKCQCESGCVHKNLMIDVAETVLKVMSEKSIADLVGASR